MKTLKRSTGMILPERNSFGLQLKLILHSRVEDFLQASRCFLEANEAAYNLILGLCVTLQQARSAPAVLLGTFYESNRCVGALLQLPPGKLLLTDGPLDQAVDGALQLGPHSQNFPGIVGPSAFAEKFARSWCEWSGQVEQAVIRQKIYQAEQIVLPRPVGGHMRLAGPAEKDLIAGWLKEFSEDSLEPESPENLRWMAERGIRASRFFVWEGPAGEVVSLAGLAGPTRRGIRVNCVFTPRQFRGQGFAANLVARLSERMLLQGRQRCYLYTDAENSTANALYQKLGYQPVCDSSRILLRSGQRPAI